MIPFKTSFEIVDLRSVSTLPLMMEPIIGNQFHFQTFLILENAPSYRIKISLLIQLTLFLSGTI